MKCLKSFSGTVSTETLAAGDKIRKSNNVLIYRIYTEFVDCEPVQKLLIFYR